MFKKFFRLIFTLCGMLFGYGVSTLVIAAVEPVMGRLATTLEKGAAVAVFVLLFGFIFFKLSPILTKLTDKTAKTLDMSISRIPAHELFAGGTGLVFGLVIAFFLSQIIYGIELLETAYLSTIIAVLIYLVLGIFGITAGLRISRNTQPGQGVFPSVRQQKISEKPERPDPKIREKGRAKRRGATPKVLDTSVIIDGRITDILKTGFMEGEIIIPDFVLVELRHIADSADALKRNRGRRGLDILNSIQGKYGIEICNTASDKALEGIHEVDVKLLRLAQSVKGMVMTNDYNLSKVAAIEGVPVLNINELANALKPAVLPGEKMRIALVKEGKETEQGVGYLEDGTMIVVEGGKQYIGKTITANVTSVLQTAAGRMIFARPEG